MYMQHGLVAACLALLSSVSHGAEIAFFSAGSSPVLIELFTSQGCNSCPPAEAHLNGYADSPRLWKDFIPLAFHVDYWDYLGWKDRFASSANSARQRDYAARGRLSTVYTPAFVVNGREWRRGWLSNKTPVAIPRAGKLQVQVLNDEVNVRLTGVSPPLPKVLNLALLGMGLSTDIGAGENRGRHSRHEFVVLAWRRERADNGQWQTQLPMPQETRAQGYALAVWLNAEDDPTPLFAAGQPLPEAMAREINHGVR